MFKYKNLRWHAFWVLDFLKGKSVRRYYNEIKNNHHNGTDINETNEKVRKLLNHAICTTKFYKEFSLQDEIGKYPITNKMIFKERFEDFLSSKYKNSKTNRIMYTSGSTGTPFAMIQNKNKIKHNTAASIYLCEQGNYFIGQKQGFLRVWVKSNHKNKLRSYIENVIMIDTKDLDDIGIKKLLLDIKKKNIQSLFGYASSFIEISNFIQRRRINSNKFHVKSIISTSEILPEATRNHLSSFFSCPVNSVYSNEENGIVGIQIDMGSRYYMDSTSYFFEVLKLECDEPAEEGQIGRIIITDLYNYAFPIIRYDTGDLAILKKSVFGKKYSIFFEEIMGRKTDMIFDCFGKKISPHAIMNFMWGIQGIKQFQFIQIDSFNYEIRINLEENRKFEEQTIFDRLIPVLGSNANLTIRYVDEVTQLNSGKRRYIINRVSE